MVFTRSIFAAIPIADGINESFKRLRIAIVM